MKLKAIKRIEDSPHWWVVTETGQLVGYLQLQDDGFYQWEHSGKGYFTSYHLRKIADLLDEVNKPYNKQLDKYFKEEKKKESYRASDHYIDPMTGIVYPKEDK